MTSTYTGTHHRQVSMYKPPKRERRNPDENVVDLLIKIIQPTIALSGAACIGHADLFDPDATPEQHEEAAQICLGCPVAQQCAEWSAAQPKNVSGILSGTLLPGPRFRTREKATT